MVRYEGGDIRVDPGAAIVVGYVHTVAVRAVRKAHMAVNTERRLRGRPPDARCIRNVADLDTCMASVHVAA
jgi:hypothetical protein